MRKRTNEKSFSALIREAIHAGAKTPHEIHLMQPSVSIICAKQACLYMVRSKSIELLPDGTVRGTPHIASEEAYRAYIRSLRSAAASARHAKARLAAATPSGADIDSPEVHQVSAIVVGKWA